MKIWNEWIETNELKCRNWNDMNEWMNVWMNEKNEWMNEWIEMNELKRMNWNERIEMNELKWMNWSEWIEMNWMTCQTWSEPPSCFLHFLCEIELSLQSRALGTFCRPHLPKVLRTQQFSCDFDMKSSSRYSPVHFLSTTFPDRAAQPRKRRPSFSDHGSHFTPKNTRFRARECFQARILAFPISHTSQLLAWCSCHDEWGDGEWCGCHHGEKASHDNRS